MYCSMREGVALITSQPTRSISSHNFTGSLASSSSARTNVKPLHSDAAVSFRDMSNDTVVTDTYTLPLAFRA